MLEHALQMTVTFTLPAILARQAKLQSLRK